MCKGFITYLDELKRKKDWKQFAKIFISAFSFHMLQETWLCDQQGCFTIYKCGTITIMKK